MGARLPTGDGPEAREQRIQLYAERVAAGLEPFTGEPRRRAAPISTLLELEERERVENFQEGRRLARAFASCQASDDAHLVPLP